MAKAKISIIGTVDKKPKFNSDGTVDLIFKGTMTTLVPKGLKNLGDSFYLVHVGPKTWKKVSSTLQEDSTLIIQGEPKANKTSSGVPLIEVVCFDISIKIVDNNNSAPKDSVKEEPAVVEIKQAIPQEKPAASNPVEIKKEKVPEVIEQKDPSPAAVGHKQKHDKFKPVVWYSPEEVFEIPVNDVLLVEKTHLITKNIDFQGMLRIVSETGILNSPIAVKPLQDRPGKYALVMGMKMLMIAKLLNFETIKAVKRDMDHKELMNSLGIKVKDN